jgi:hypothetical protein
MKRILVVLLLSLSILTGCDTQQQPRAIDSWQTTVDQGW